MTTPTILTGIRANNDLTIGNYFGALLPIIDMAREKSDEYQINLFIPDLHSFTTPIDHAQFYDQILQNARIFTAAGLPIDNENIFLYRQSYIPAHSELTWILDCFTGFGEMSRMTQFKDKSLQIEKNALQSGVVASVPKGYSPGEASIEKARDRISVGLFNYPVLMAADILLYNAKYIPVGEDQTQHLEFTRDIAERMNARFGELFTVPEPVSKQHEFFGKDQGLRIKDLLDPTKKMSKSDESGRGVIFLSDNPKDGVKKIMGATTDDKAEIHYDKANQPGISNLLEILALLRGKDKEEVIREFEGESRYGDFKKIVASEVETFLTAFQTNLANVDDAMILRKLESSEATLSLTANQTLLRAQQAVGLRPKSD